MGNEAVFTDGVALVKNGLGNYRLSRESVINDHVDPLVGVIGDCTELSYGAV